MVLDGKTTSLAELAASGRARPSLITAGAIELPIPARARIRARSGKTTFVVSAVPQPRRHATPLLAGLESRAMSYFAGSLAVHLGVWVLLQQIPQDDSSATLDLAVLEPTAINTSNHTNEEMPPKVDQDDGTGGKTDGEAKPMALDSGQSGRPEVARVDGHIQIKDTHRDPQLARQQAIEEARTAGILGPSSALNGGFQSLTEIGDTSSAFDDATMYGAIYGADAGESHGYFGGGLSGFGRGGGCTQEPCGLIGTSTRYGASVRASTRAMAGVDQAASGWARAFTSKVFPSRSDRPGDRRWRPRQVDHPPLHQAQPRQDQLLLRARAARAPDARRHDPGRLLHHAERHGEGLERHRLR